MRRSTRPIDAKHSRHPDAWAVQNAALLVYIASDRIDRAEATLRSLQRLASVPTIEAFALAGAGMLAFAKGRPDAGQKLYEDAIHAARKARRPDLVFSAYVFWVLGEAKAGTLTRSTFDDAVKDVPRILRRLPSDNRIDSEKLWRAVKLQAEEAIPLEVPTISSATALVRMARDLPERLSD